METGAPKDARSVAWSMEGRIERRFDLSLLTEPEAPRAAGDEHRAEPRNRDAADPEEDVLWYRWTSRAHEHDPPDDEHPAVSERPIEARVREGFDDLLGRFGETLIADHG